MAQVILRPNGTVTAGWSLFSAATTHQCIDDPILDPTDAVGSGDGANINTTGSATAEVALDDVPSFASVSSLVLRQSANSASTAPVMDWGIYKGTTLIVGGTQMAAGAGSAWRTATANNPSLTLAEANDLRIRFTSSGGIGGALTVFAAYVEFNYAPAGGTGPLMGT